MGWGRGDKVIEKDESVGVRERGQSYRVRRVCGCGGEGKTSVKVKGRGKKVIE